MARIFMMFPGGRNKALTLSYDDGVQQDMRLIEIMKANGLKGTFNINTGLFAPEGTVFPEGVIHRRMTRRQCLELYKDSGMEVAVHGLTHPFLEQLATGCCVHEIITDRMNLEIDYGCIIRGMAYPFGTYNDNVVSILKQCGIVYARTVVSTHSFDIPQDWLRLPATCHHDDPDLMKLANDFLEEDRYGRPKLFYLWGHSYEFEQKDNWHVIEEFAGFIGNRDDVWYATNIEIYEYIEAYNRLIFSADGTSIYNPSSTQVYFSLDGKIYSIVPGAKCQIHS